MTDEQRKMLNRITAVAEKVIDNPDPMVTPISTQLNLLKPVMHEISLETGRSIEDIFIEYMDLASEAAVENVSKVKEDYLDFPDLNI